MKRRQLLAYAALAPVATRVSAEPFEAWWVEYSIGGRTYRIAGDGVPRLHRLVDVVCEVGADWIRIGAGTYRA